MVLSNFNVSSPHCEFSLIKRPNSFEFKILFTGGELVSELLLRCIPSGCISRIRFQVKLNS